MYQKVDTKLDFASREGDIAKFWKDNKNSIHIKRMQKAFYNILPIFLKYRYLFTIFDWYFYWQ